MSRRSSRGIEPIGDVVGRAAALKLEASRRAPPVSPRDWESAVGTRIAARARPVKLDRGVLLVRAASATWAQELTLLAGVIIDQLRARGVMVESLRFFVGPVDPPERPPWRQEVRTTPPAATLPSSVKRELARVADPGLRDAIAKAASRNLGWQAAREGKQADGPRDAAATLAAPAAPLAAPAATSATSAARGPQPAASRSAPQDRTSTRYAGGRRGNRERR